MAGVVDIRGSPQWQTVVCLIMAAWILVSVIRGWRKGLMRHLVGLVAFLVAGYLALHYADPVSDFLRPHLPALFVLPLAIVLLWILSFNLIVLVGFLLFKRTRDCESPTLRLIYGVGGGIIGLGFALLFVWCFLIGLKVIGHIAENQVEIQQKRNESSGVLILNLAKLKRSVELSDGRDVLDAIDPLPPRFYRDLDQYSRVLEDGEAFRKLLEYPGFRRIFESQQLLALERDPQITADLQKGNLIAVLANRKTLALFNDPQIRRVLTMGNLEGALDYASASRGTVSESAPGRTVPFTREHENERNGP